MIIRQKDIFSLFPAMFIVVRNASSAIVVIFNRPLSEKSLLVFIARTVLKPCLALSLSQCFAYFPPFFPRAEFALCRDSLHFIAVEKRRRCERTRLTRLTKGEREGGIKEASLYDILMLNKTPFSPPSSVMRDAICPKKGKIFIFLIGTTRLVP